jgi:hypothetical protein
VRVCRGRPTRSCWSGAACRFTSQSPLQLGWDCTGWLLVSGRVCPWLRSPAVGGRGGGEPFAADSGPGWSMERSGRSSLSTALATRVPVRVQTHTRARAHTHTHACTRARAHTHTYTHARAQTHARTRTHTRTHKATNNHTHIAPDGAPNIYGCYCAEYKHGALIAPITQARSNRPLQLLPLLRTSTSGRDGQSSRAQWTQLRLLDSRYEPEFDKSQFNPA